MFTGADRLSPVEFPAFVVYLLLFPYRPVSMIAQVTVPMTPELETSTEIRKTQHRWLDISVALCALVVSITSLCVAVLHGHTMERMADANARLVAANSWPLMQRVSSDQDASGARVFSLILSNSGVGPAKIETAEVRWKGRAYRDFQELIDACCQPKDGPRFEDIQTSSMSHLVWRAGESRPVLLIPRNGDAEPVAEAFRNIWTQLEMRVCYCSVFDECWLSDLRSLHPPAAKECPKPEVMFN